MLSRAKKEITMVQRARRSRKAGIAQCDMVSKGEALKCGSRRPRQVSVLEGGRSLRRGLGLERAWLSYRDA